MSSAATSSQRQMRTRAFHLGRRVGVVTIPIACLVHFFLFLVLICLVVEFVFDIYTWCMYPTYPIFPFALICYLAYSHCGAVAVTLDPSRGAVAIYFVLVFVCRQDSSEYMCTRFSLSPSLLLSFSLLSPSLLLSLSRFSLSLSRSPSLFSLCHSLSTLVLTISLSASSLSPFLLCSYFCFSVLFNRCLVMRPLRAPHHQRPFPLLRRFVSFSRFPFFLFVKRYSYFLSTFVVYVFCISPPVHFFVRRFSRTVCVFLCLCVFLIRA